MDDFYFLNRHVFKRLNSKEQRAVITGLKEGLDVTQIFPIIIDYRTIKLLYMNYGKENAQKYINSMNPEKLSAFRICFGGV